VAATPAERTALRYWRDEFWRFNEGRYYKLPCSELQAEVSEFIRENFVREKVANKQGQIIPVTRNVVGNVVQAITSGILVPVSYLSTFSSIREK
jgi:hypothetical protein